MFDGNIFIVSLLLNGNAFTIRLEKNYHLLLPSLLLDLNTVIVSMKYLSLLIENLFHCLTEISSLLVQNVSIV